jgi:hypothetical protein
MPSTREHTMIPPVMSSRLNTAARNVASCSSVCVVVEAREGDAEFGRRQYPFMQTVVKRQQKRRLRERDEIHDSRCDQE